VIWESQKKPSKSRPTKKKNLELEKSGRGEKTIDRAKRESGQTLKENKDVEGAEIRRQRQSQRGSVPRMQKEPDTFKQFWDRRKGQEYPLPRAAEKDPSRSTYHNMNRGGLPGPEQHWASSRKSPKKPARDGRKKRNSSDTKRSQGKTRRQESGEL